MWLARSALLHASAIAFMIVGIAVPASLPTGKSATRTGERQATAPTSATVGSAVSFDASPSKLHDLVCSVAADDLKARDESIRLLDRPHFTRPVRAMLAGVELDFQGVRVRVVVDAEQSRAA